MATPNATFVQEGHAIDYTPAAAVSAGAIVSLGELVGIAKSPIAASALGALAIEGVFQIVKSGSSGPIFAIGDPVFWDTVNSLAVKTGSNAAGLLFLGTAIEAAATGDSSVKVKLRPHGLPASLMGRTWEDVSLAGGSKTLDAEDLGKVMNITAGHATNVVTLPAIAAGLSQFVIRAAVGGQRIAVSPNASDKFMGPDFTGTDDKDQILAAATAVQGDFIELDYGGANGYAIVRRRGVWATE